MAWAACNKLSNAWTFNQSNKIKINIFKTTIEPILLYVSETWILSSQQQKGLDDSYTKLLMRAKSLSWEGHPTL